MKYTISGDIVLSSVRSDAEKCVKAPYLLGNCLINCSIALEIQDERTQRARIFLMTATYKTSNSFFFVYSKFLTLATTGRARSVDEIDGRKNVGRRKFF